MTAVFQSSDPVVAVGPDWLDTLKREAAGEPLRRSRLCLHRSGDDLVHEMVIGFQRDTLVRPHRHDGKSESFHVLEGELEIVVFDDAGDVRRRYALAPAADGSRPFIYRMNSRAWHSVRVRSDFAVIRETTTGPFVPGDADFPDWAPAEGEELRDWLVEADRVQAEAAAAELPGKQTTLDDGVVILAPAWGQALAERAQAAPDGVAQLGLYRPGDRVEESLIALAPGASFSRDCPGSASIHLIQGRLAVGDSELTPSATFLVHHNDPGRLSISAQAPSLVHATFEAPG